MSRETHTTPRTARKTAAEPKEAQGQTPAAATQKEASKDDRNMREVYGPIGYLKELFTRFGADQCGSWAASLSFFGILSIVPILLCALAVLGFVIRSPHEAAVHVEQIIRNVVPGKSGADAAAELVKEMNIEKSAESLLQNRGIAGLIGILSLFWSSIQIFVNAIPPINAAFRVKETRNFLKLRLTALALLFGAGGLFLLSLLPTSGAQLLTRLSLLSEYEAMKPLVRFFFFVLSVAINAVMFTVLYRYLPSPKARMDWRSAGFAGVIIAVLWEAAKQGFGFYLTRFGSYNKVYGSLGGLIGLIFWIYYSSMILLLGAEIASLYRDAKRQEAQG